MASINLVYVSDYSKMSDRFKDKKPVYAAFHAGSISQNVYLYCASAGLGAVVRDSVDRAGLKQVLNLSEDQVIVMVQSVGYASGNGTHALQSKALSHTQSCEKRDA